MADGLTPEQEKYCQLRASGMTQTDAHQMANKNSKASRANHSSAASRAERLQKIQDRLAELREQVNAGAIADLQQIQADLYRIANDETKPDGVRLKAYDQLTRMQGGYRDNLEQSINVTLDERRDAITRLLEAPAAE